MPLSNTFALRLTAASLIVSMLSACGDQNEKSTKTIIPTSTPTATQVSSRVLDGSDHLTMPGDLAVVGRYLVLINPSREATLRVYEAETGKVVRAFGREGKGPGEFQSAWTLDPVAGSPSSFWVHDLQLQRLTFVDLEKDFGADETYGSRILRLQGSGPATNPIWSGDTLLVSSGYFADPGRLAQFDQGGRLQAVVGEPPPGQPSTPVQVRQHAYQSTIKGNSTGSLIAVATRHADRLQIFRPDGTLVSEARRPANFEPVYKSVIRAGHPSMSSGDDLRFGYVDLAATDAHVYALYSGRTRRDFPGEAVYGEYVYIYDWNANLRTVLRLDAAASSIAVDESKKKLYAVQHLPAPAVVVYDLPVAGTP